MVMNQYISIFVKVDHNIKHSVLYAEISYAGNDADSNATIYTNKDTTYIATYFAKPRHEFVNTHFILGHL